MALDIVDILCVVAQQLVLVLAHPDELVSRRPLMQVWEDFSSEGVEEGGIGIEGFEIEHFLWILEPFGLKFGVETCGLGSEVWNS